MDEGLHWVRFLGEAAEIKLPPCTVRSNKSNKKVKREAPYSTLYSRRFKLNTVVDVVVMEGSGTQGCNGDGW